MPHIDDIIFARLSREDYAFDDYHFSFDCLRLSRSRKHFAIISFARLPPVSIDEDLFTTLQDADTCRDVMPVAFHEPVKYAEGCVDWLLHYWLPPWKIDHAARGNTTVELMKRHHFFTEHYHFRVSMTFLLRHKNISSRGSCLFIAISFQKADYFMSHRHLRIISLQRCRWCRCSSELRLCISRLSDEKILKHYFLRLSRMKRLRLRNIISFRL